MILNPNKFTALVVSRSRNANPPHGDLFLSGVTFELVPTLTFLAWSLTAVSPSKTMCVVLSPVPLKELVFWGGWSMSLWTPLCCFVATIHLFSQSLSIVLRCGGLVLKAIFSFSSAKQSRSAKQTIESLFVQWVSICFCQNPTNSSCGCSSSISVWSIKVYNVPICKVFPAGSDPCMEWPQASGRHGAYLHCVWHRNVRWV